MNTRCAQIGGGEVMTSQSTKYVVNPRIYTFRITRLKVISWYYHYLHIFREQNFFYFITKRLITYDLKTITDGHSADRVTPCGHCAEGERLAQDLEDHGYYSMQC